MEKVLIVQRMGCEELPTNYDSAVVEVEVVEDVIIALYKIKKESYRFIIIDMGSSRICGIDLLKIIRSNPKNHRLKIALSAQNYNYKYINEGFIQGADFFLKMPLKINEIEEIVLGLNALDYYVDLELIARNEKYDFLDNQ